MPLKRLFLSLLAGFVLSAVFAEELFSNPNFANDASGWANWGKKKGLLISAVSDGVLMQCDAPGLNQGLAQSIKLKAGSKYEYSCKVKGELGEDAYVNILSYYCANNKKMTGRARTIASSFEWDVHKITFNTPEDLTDAVLFRPVILFGAGKITLQWASLKEVGEAEENKKETVGKLPEIVPVVHPMLKIDLSAEQPQNIRAHVNESLQMQLPGAASVQKKDDAFVINYAFTTSGHDAIIFDIVKEIPSCAKISMQVESDGKGHKMFFVLNDASGESHLVPRPLLLDFQKRQVTFNLALPKEEPYSILDSIWGGDGNQHLDLPLRSISIVIDDAPDSSIDSGLVTIKNLNIGNW